MKNEKYFVGLDIGTDSVGYAATDEKYELCRYKGEAMWGVTLFDAAEAAAKRRGFRTARRRLDRRQQRVRLVMELFAGEVSKVDEGFYKRIQESYLYPEEKADKVRLFDTYEQQKAYMTKYPTIHHLILELMNDPTPHDVRLVYIACAWLVAHRGHFLSEVDKNKVDDVTNFGAVYDRLCEFLRREDGVLPWNEEGAKENFKSILSDKIGVLKKTKELTAALFPGKTIPKNDEEDGGGYDYACIIKLLCGGEVELKKLFGKDEYGELAEKKISLGMDDEKLAVILQSIGDDAELIAVLKAVYDWSVLVDLLDGEKSISAAKVAIYEEHKKNLHGDPARGTKGIKKFLKAYAPEEYVKIFRSVQEKDKNTYAAYIGNNKTNGKREKYKKAVKADLSKRILSVMKEIAPKEEDETEWKEIIDRLEANTFLPKQVDGDNRVIPYQLYWFELNQILKNAQEYIPFLKTPDTDGITGKEKILSVFEFRIPYYVGPLKEKSSEKLNHWMVRKAEGKIYPWNFNDKVDLDKSEQAFIDRMTNSCTYLPGEDVLPKNSLLYSAFQVLNEINNIEINGKKIPVDVKQGIYNDVFMKHEKVTPKRIVEYLQSNNYMEKTDMLSGLDVTVKSSLKPFIKFKRLLEDGQLSSRDVEKIIERATYSEDKARFEKYLRKDFPSLSEENYRYISGMKWKEFGRLSEKLLCGIEGTNKETGEVYTMIRAMWETNYNFMQLLSDQFTFRETINAIVKEYYDTNKKSLSERLDEMYISNAVKRPIIRTLDILKDIVKVQGCPPSRIFIEMARGTIEDEKGKRSSSRLDQIRALYQTAEELSRELNIEGLTAQLDAWGDNAHNKLQKKTIFLYFLQFGRCLYTNEPIDLNALFSDSKVYDIDHIYPRSFVKDDSLLNNLVLVKSEANGEKSDRYPVADDIRKKMRPHWDRLHKIGAINDEKYKRLIRHTVFGDKERFEFCNRQLVETRQSTKVLATLLKELYPETEIVYVKAGLTSDFRSKFDLLKSRNINDLHHAKDAYLNIVTGNVWHCKFSKDFWRAENDNNVKPEVVFTHKVVCKGETVWNGESDKERVVKIAQKNTAHMTKFAFSRKGGFFDQNPLKANEGLTELKKGRPTEIYGGYNKPTATFFVLVKFTIKKKKDVMVMPVELLYADKFLSDDTFAEKYAKDTIKKIKGKEPDSVEFLLNKRPIKVGTILSLDGYRVFLAGKTGERILIRNFTPFKTSPENEKYVKNLESYDNKRKKNDKIKADEKHDGISAEKNKELYECYIEKLRSAPFKYRQKNPREILEEGREQFIGLDLDRQITVLLAIQGLFGREKTADLTAIGGATNDGVQTLSSYISNWKNYYTDVRIVDSSSSGLFEAVSVNLLELL